VTLKIGHVSPQVYQLLAVFFKMILDRRHLSGHVAKLNGTGFRGTNDLAQFSTDAK
jgi:hypothetical protein